MRFDTGLRGKRNGGHLYGTALPDNQKNALIEYLKTLRWVFSLARG